MIGNYVYTLVHKSHRSEKLANKKNRRGQYVTPPKSVWRKQIHSARDEQANKKGYDYDEKSACTKLKWMKQEFEDKMFKYLGGHHGQIKHMTRLDKVKRKEELDFKRQVNPVLQIFLNIDRIIEAKLKSYALRCLF